MLERFRPDEAAVEETFVNKNPASTLKLGVARGVVLLAPAERGLPVAEYSANLIKKSVVGAGHAEKEQVQLMVRRLLPGCAIEQPDAADALAVAICHAHHAGDAAGLERRAMIAKLSGIARFDRAGGRGDRCRRGRLSRFLLDAHAGPAAAARRRGAALLSRRMCARTTSTSTALSMPPSATGSAC